MTLSFFLEELLFIPSSSWFGDSVFGTDDTDFGSAHSVIAGVGHNLIPHEGNRFVFKSPGGEYSDRDIELRTGGPHIADSIMRGDVLYIHIA